MKMQTIFGILTWLSAVDGAAACYELYDHAGVMLYEGPQPPFDMTYPDHNSDYQASVQRHEQLRINLHEYCWGGWKSSAATGSAPHDAPKPQIGHDGSLTEDARNAFLKSIPEFVDRRL